MQSVFSAFGLFWCVLSCSAVFSSSFRWHILYFKSWKTTFKKVSLEQKTIILNLDHIRKTSSSFITFMSVYSGAASRISGIIHPGSKKKENTLFQMQASIYMGNVLKWLIAKFLAPYILIEKLDERPHTSFQIHKISNGHKMFPIKCQLLFLVYFILSEDKWYIRGSAVDL